MKKIITLLVTVILFTTTQAKIWRVNNNPSLDADVLQASTLFDNTNNATNPEAAAGDSIYFEPSASNYNGVDVNKANITILGYGYLLSANPGMQVNTNNAIIAHIYFSNGSAGSSVSGMEMANNMYISTSNITVTRCKVPIIYFNHSANATGIRIDKCFITNGIFDGGMAPSVTNVIIAVENCIFSSIADATNISGFSLPNKVRGLFRNNTLNYCSSFYAFNFYVANNVFTNNLNFGTVSNSGNNVFRNNLFSYPSNNTNYAQVGANTAPNSNNLFAVNMATVFNGTTDNTYNGTTLFNNYINAGAFNTETRFELKPSSNPAIGAGETGVTFNSTAVTTPNCGAYGATDPYRKGGFPAIPRITSLSVPATVPNGAANITISISSSSNN
jgi:hypothetical protein